MAEFASAETLVAAARRTRAAGYRRLDAYAPFPVDELPDALDLPPSRIPLFMLGGGLAGAAAGLGMQYYHANLHAYPMNIGGRPLNAWPAFIPATFELIILFRGAGRLGGAVFHPAPADGLPPGLQPSRFPPRQPGRLSSCASNPGPAAFRRAQRRVFLRTLATRSPCKPSRNESRFPDIAVSGSPWRSPPWRAPAGGLRQPQNRHEDQAADAEQVLRGRPVLAPAARAQHRAGQPAHRHPLLRRTQPGRHPGHADAVAGQPRRARARPDAVHGHLRELPRRGRLRAGHHRAARAFPRRRRTTNPGCCKRRWATCTT